MEILLWVTMECEISNARMLLLWVKWKLICIFFYAYRILFIYIYLSWNGMFFGICGIRVMRNALWYGNVGMEKSKIWDIWRESDRRQNSCEEMVKGMNSSVSFLQGFYSLIFL